MNKTEEERLAEIEEALANIMAQYPAVFKHFFQHEIEKIRARKT